MLGAKVQPVAPSIFRSRPWLAVFGSRFRQSLRNWSHFQIGHQHHYSVEHLLAFRDYCERTSRTRVFLVCTTSLVPAFIVAILVECITLRPPTEGWKANYAYWIRLFVSSVPSTIGSNFIVKEGTDPGALTSLRVVVASICGNVCNTAFLIGIAAISTFPIPCGAVLTVVPYAIFNIITLLQAIGPFALSKSAKLRQQVGAQICAFAALGVMQVIYSSFGFVFNQLSGYKQTSFVLVLPVIKFLVKQCVARAYKHYRECIGPIIVFSVDLCNVLYVVSCMQSSGSLLTTFLMVGTDAFFVALALHSIYAQSNTTRVRPSDATYLNNVDYLVEQMTSVKKAFKDSSAAHSLHIRVAARFALPLSNESTQFIAELRRLEQRNNKLASDHRVPVTSTSTLSNPMLHQVLSIPSVRDVDETIITQLIKSQQVSDISSGPNHNQLTRFNSSRLSTKTSTVKSASIRSGSHSFYSPNSSIPFRIASSPTAVRFSNHEHITQEVQDALQALFHSEYVLMTEYVECAVPMLYVLYLTFLYHLPTAAYYPQTSSMNYDQLVRTQISIVCYALLELASFVVLNILVKRRFGFSPLYQLAFVLETQMRTVQSFLFVWVLSILEMNLVHNGADVTTPSQ